MPDLDCSKETAQVKRKNILNKICLDYLERRVCTLQIVMTHCDFWSRSTSFNHVAILRSEGLVEKSLNVRTVGLMPTLAGLDLSVSISEEVHTASLVIYADLLKIQSNRLKNPNPKNQCNFCINPCEGHGMESYFRCPFHLRKYLLAKDRRTPTEHGYLCLVSDTSIGRKF